MKAGRRLSRESFIASASGLSRIGAVGLVQSSRRTGMILYHFTCVEHLESIMQEGLTRGDVPTRFKGPLSENNAVWLTTEPQPEGHGLGGDAQMLTEEDRKRHFEIFGVLPSEGAWHPNKKVVRITVVIPSTDRRLVRWLKWGRKHCEPGLYDALSEGNLHKTWWLYFGTVAPDQFRAVHYLAKHRAGRR
jgi:hypothetical protein